MLGMLVSVHNEMQHQAFMTSARQGTGLSADELAACDALVYIPQHGAGTASLNVAVAASIVLHHFAVWAGYAERSRTGAKFDVGARQPRTARRGARHEQAGTCVVTWSLDEGKLCFDV